MKSVILIVLDGFGIAPPGPGNAITLANLMNYNSFLQLYPNTTLKASGEAVGLPQKEVGNTEVGHLSLGAGRIIYQDLPRINLSIADGSFYQRPALTKVIEHLKGTGGKLHLIGLLGEGTVHASLEHLYALLYFGKENNLQNLFIHVITDGRDSPPQSAMEIIGGLEEKLKQISIGRIATVMGRYYAMDRDRRWERTEKAYNSLTKGQGHYAASSNEAIKRAYAAKKTDEFIEPTVIIKDNKPLAFIEQGDAVIFLNYRIDRPRELTKAFVLDNFESDANKSFSFDPYATKYYKTHYPKENLLSSPFQRGKKIKDLLFVTMTEYEKGLATEVVFPPIEVSSPFSRVLSEHGILQLKMAETEKERFVTFYFNGQKESPFEGEQRIIIPSPKVATYDLKPEMSAIELTNILIEKMREARYGFILLNFANPDMVGHTGHIQATVSSLQTVDNCLGKIVNALNNETTLIITADHGNAEQKINPATGGISTEHTANPVPFLAISKAFRGQNARLQSGILADVAPTILNLLEIPVPSEMKGRNLLEELR